MKRNLINNLKKDFELTVCVYKKIKISIILAAVVLQLYVISCKSASNIDPKALSGISGDAKNIPKADTFLSSAQSGPKKFGTFPYTWFGKVISVGYSVTSYANNNESILLELAINYDEKSSQILGGIPTEDWFNLESTGVQKLKGAETLKIYRWQIVPDAVKELTLIKIKSKAVDAYLFARYRDNAGDPPKRIDPYKNVAISFGQDNFSFKQFEQEAQFW